MSRWGDEKTTNFIRLYRSHECLWNILSPNYKNKICRDNAYTQILEDMKDSNLTIKDVKNKIKGLRSTYHQELTKISRSGRSRDGATDVYKPSLTWFHEMDFLQDTLEYRGTLKVRRSPSQVNTEAPYQLALEIPECVLDVNSNDPSKLRQRARKRKKTGDETVTPHRLEKSAVNNNSRSNEDEFYFFGLSVAAQLRTLPLVNALDMQSKIQTLLSTERRKMYQEQSTPCSQSCIDGLVSTLNK